MDHTGLNVTQFFWLLLAALVVALAARRVQMPYALALVITGLIIGMTRLLPQTHLDPTVLLTVFLPPLLFEAAIHLRADALRQNWKPIAIYTLAGTILSTFIVGGLTAWAFHLPLPAALVFGALISPTDPISVIAVFKRLGANRRLTLILEAESLFNDTIAVILFTVMLAAVYGGKISAVQGTEQFFRLVIGGAALGGGIGWLASRIHFEIDDHLVEITLTTVVAFGSYLSAQALGVSGVMAVVAAGLVIGNVGMPTAMSPGTRLAVSALWEYAAFVVNSLVFLLVGIEVAYVQWTDKIGLVLAAIVIVLTGRAAIYPLSGLVNRLGGRIALAWQHALFWGGLRGALSMALVLGLRLDFPQRDALVAATFGVVLFSLLVQGFTLRPLMARLKLTGAESEALPATTAHRAALAAEKSALQEAARQGWLSQDDWRRIAARIDAELAALETDR